MVHEVCRVVDMVRNTDPELNRFREVSSSVTSSLLCTWLMKDKIGVHSKEDGMPMALTPP